MILQSAKRARRMTVHQVNEKSEIQVCSSVEGASKYHKRDDKFGSHHLLEAGLSRIGHFSDELKLGVIVVSSYVFSSHLFEGKT